jgi:nucleoside-diphosphate-sugar epimerase
VFYNILLPDSTIPTPSFGYVDVRDVARALVAGMKKKGKNRILLSGEWFQHKDAVDYIASVRPELKSRLPTLESTGQTESVVDNARAIEILGIQPPRPWKESVLDTVDELIRVEKNWAAEGVDVDTVLGHSARWIFELLS